MPVWAQRRAMLDEAKPHYASAIAAVVAAAASAYGASQQAAAAKKSKLAAANAAAIGGGGGEAALKPTAADVRSIREGGLFDKALSDQPEKSGDFGGKSYTDLMAANPAATKQPDNLLDQPMMPAATRTYADLVGSTPSVPQEAPAPQGDPQIAKIWSDAPATVTPEASSSSGPSVGQYAQGATQTLQLLQTLLAKRPMQPSPIPQPNPNPYTPTAQSYRDLMLKRRY